MDAKFNEIINFCKLHSDSKNYVIYEKIKIMLNEFDLKSIEYDEIINKILEILDL